LVFRRGCLAGKLKKKLTLSQKGPGNRNFLFCGLKKSQNKTTTMAADLALTLRQAREKYGDKIFAMKLIDLAAEFGPETFPSWIARFTEELPLQEIPETRRLAEIELWEITESFCYADKQLYRGAQMYAPYAEVLTREELAYFEIFSTELAYTPKWNLLSV